MLWTTSQLTVTCSAHFLLLAERSSGRGGWGHSRESAWTRRKQHPISSFILFFWHFSKEILTFWLGNFLSKNSEITRKARDDFEKKEVGEPVGGEGWSCKQQAEEPKEWLKIQCCSINFFWCGWVLKSFSSQAVWSSLIWRCKVQTNGSTRKREKSSFYGVFEEWLWNWQNEVPLVRVSWNSYYSETCQVELTTIVAYFLNDRRDDSLAWSDSNIGVSQNSEAAIFCAFLCTSKISLGFYTGCIQVWDILIWHLEKKPNHRSVEQAFPT